MNNVRNQVTGEYGAVPDTARYYKVIILHVHYMYVVLAREVHLCDYFVFQNPSDRPFC